MTCDLLGTNGANNTDLYRHRIVAQNHPLSNLAFRQLIIVLEVIRIVVAKVLHGVLVLGWHHHSRTRHHLWLECQSLLHLRHHRIAHHLLRSRIR